jgi:divalent metal cation (Fe/Co/Zn/Cd) transporter
VVSIVGALKGFTGFFSGSVSLLAQSIDSFTDLISLVAFQVGMRLSTKPPTERFQYGYYGFEIPALIVTSILILISGGGGLRGSILKMLVPRLLSANNYARPVAASSIPMLYQLSK